MAELADVKAIALSNITLSGAQTIDGVSIVATDRVAVAGQTNLSENGIYVAAAGAWARSSDSTRFGQTFRVLDGTPPNKLQRFTMVDELAYATLTVGTSNAAYTVTANTN